MGGQDKGPPAGTWRGRMIGLLVSTLFSRGGVACHSSRRHQVFCTRSVLGPRRVGWVPGC